LDKHNASVSSARLNRSCALTVVCAVGLLSIVATAPRSNIAELSMDYAAPIIVALNSVVGIINVLRRSMFVRAPGELRLQGVAVIAVSCLALSGLLWNRSAIWSSVLMFLAIQLVIVGVLDFGRHRLILLDEKMRCICISGRE